MFLLLDMVMVHGLSYFFSTLKINSIRISDDKLISVRTSSKDI